MVQFANCRNFSGKIKWRHHILQYLLFFNKILKIKSFGLHPTVADLSTCLVGDAERLWIAHWLKNQDRDRWMLGVFFKWNARWIFKNPMEHLGTMWKLKDWNFSPRYLHWIPSGMFLLSRDEPLKCVDCPTTSNLLNFEFHVWFCFCLVKLLYSNLTLHRFMQMPGIFATFVNFPKNRQIGL